MTSTASHDSAASTFNASKKASLGRAVNEAKNTAHIGIEIGIDRVRLTSITRYHPELERFDSLGRFQFEFPSIGTTNTQTPESVAHAIDIICDRLPRCTDIRRPITAVGLSVDWFRLQVVFGHEIDEIQEQLANQFARQGFRRKLISSFWPVVGEHHGAPNLEDQYVLFSIPENTIQLIADRIGGQGYHIRSVVPTPVVLADAALPMTGVDAQCIVWIDEHTAWISVMHRSGLGMVRRLPAPQVQPTQGQRSLNRTTSCSTTAMMHLSTLRPYLRNLSNAICETIDYACKADMNQPSNRPVLIAGPFAELTGIESELASNLELPVAIWSTIQASKPFDALSDSDEPDSKVWKEDCRFATALSLSRYAARVTSMGGSNE